MGGKTPTRADGGVILSYQILVNRFLNFKLHGNVNLYAKV